MDAIELVADKPQALAVGLQWLELKNANISANGVEGCFRNATTAFILLHANIYFIKPTAEIPSGKLTVCY